MTSSGGQPRAGVDLGPNRLIAAGLVNQISELGWNVNYSTQHQFLDVPYNPLYANSPGSKGELLADPDIGRMKKPRLVSAVCERVAGKVEEIAGKGWLPLTLGGDHSLVSSRGGGPRISERHVGLMVGFSDCCRHKSKVPRRKARLGRCACGYQHAFEHRYG